MTSFKQIARTAARTAARTRATAATATTTIWATACVAVCTAGLTATAAAPAYSQTAAPTVAPNAAATPADSPALGCATVEVHNVRPQQGFLMGAAFSDLDSYNKKPAARVRVAAGNAITTFQLCGLRGDTVALTLFQDLDSDGKMNQNLLGMPTEPWGASGSPGMFGPKWETTQVTLDGTAIVVKMSQ